MRTAPPPERKESIGAGARMNKLTELQQFKESNMALKLIGKKRGMTQLFDELGQLVPCTLIEVEPNVVTQVKTRERDGYTALQVASEKVVCNDERTVVRRLGKPRCGHFAKNGIAPRRHLCEAKIASTEGYTLGQELTLAELEGIDFVDVTGRSKGKGYQGVMKLHGFRGGPGAHGSGFHRHAGSTGMRSTPGHCLKGGPRASHMGDEQVTVQSLRVMKVDTAQGLLIVKGQVPGARNGVVYIGAGVKRKKALAKKSK